jgi:predicted nucleotide-binding protein
VFDPDWGVIGAWSSNTAGEWTVYDYDTVVDEIMRRAGVESTGPIVEAARNAEAAFQQARNEILPILDAVLEDHEDKTLRRERDRIEELRSHVTATEFASTEQPHQIVTRDSRALAEAMQGFRVPHHLSFQSFVLEQASYGMRVKELATIARRIEKYLIAKYKMKGNTVAKTEGTIFIGHGHSDEWRKLSQFIQNRLQLQPEEFSSEPTAGRTTVARLQQMLYNAVFAFLILTSEDEQADGAMRARQNVIHEAGLFQGRLGFERAIVLLEEGCEEFSNIHGLGQIRFPRGHIDYKFEEIRAVLEHEGLLRR